MKDYLPHIPGFINDTINSLHYFRPELALTCGFLLVIIADLFFKKIYSLPFYITLLCFFAVGFYTIQQLHTAPANLFSGMIIIDHLGALFKLIFLLAGLLFIFFLKNNRQFIAHNKGTGDIFSILLAVILGMNLMAMTSNLLMLYISIEMVSIGSYLMVGYISKDTRQTEGAMKYIIFGSVCSAIMLYGLSLMYGFTGTLDLNNPQFIQELSRIPSLASGTVIIMVLTGIGFKLSVVPFHFWSPDVYEGAPTPVSAFLSTGPKAAGFAILVKFISAFQLNTDPEIKDMLSILNHVLIIAAIASMIAGNFGAIRQNNAKRMLAYSSIGHTGFLLMAVIAFSETGFKALIFYLFIYVIMNMAAFMLINEAEEITGSESVEDYKGLGKHYPVLMICFVVVLVSLTGLPPTAGFTAKFLVFSSAVEIYQSSGSFWILLLMITGAITTLVSLFYYFKIPLNAFIRSSNKLIQVKKYSQLMPICIVLSVALLLLLLLPQIITSFI
ncbi:MAG TPA: NADH-quinone oxidoreductase subunit N [Sphingobacteriaceae bacterium]|nr:NADH-quinone oxidoreductase subunit N [Sphingobacteriaceae bacterium]